MFVGGGMKVVKVTSYEISLQFTNGETETDQVSSWPKVVQLWSGKAKIQAQAKLMATLSKSICKI